MIALAISFAVDHLAGSDRLLRFSRHKNLTVSALGCGMMFLIWTLPSVLGVMLQSAHDADPSVYHFEGAGGPRGQAAFRGCRRPLSLAELCKVALRA